MTRRSLVLAVLAWVAVVISASAVTWAVIDAAGQQVLSASDVPPQVAAPAQPPVPGPSTGPTRRTPRPSPTRSRPATPAPASRTAAPAPTPTPAPAPTRPSPSVEPSPTRQTRPPSAPVSQQRTWQGPSGSVAVRCAGGSASLQSASPSDGYRVEVGARGPGEVEVTFKGEEREVKVRAGCVSGTPRFSIESRGGERSDD